jgi:hypothetical protein
MGAVTWATRQRPVSHPRSSNRTCGFPASGFPTGFIVRPTTATVRARVEGIARPVHRRHVHERIGLRHALALCAVCGGSFARGHRHADQRLRTRCRGGVTPSPKLLISPDASRHRPFDLAQGAFSDPRPNLLGRRRTRKIQLGARLSYPSGTDHTVQLRREGLPK